MYVCTLYPGYAYRNASKARISGNVIKVIPAGMSVRRQFYEEVDIQQALQGQAREKTWVIMHV
jgi:hypothetical protein